MKKSVSVKDIAKKLNISLSTVHKALTGKPGVGEERRRQVLDTAHEMGYTVNPVAQSLSRKDINIGIFMPSHWQDYFESMRRGIEKEIENLQKYKVRGFFYDISSDFSDADAAKAVSWLQENSIDALIYCPSMYSLNEAFVSAVKKSALPVFLAGGELEGIESVSRIETDAALAGKLAADFLRCVRPQGLKAAVFTGALRIKSHKDKVDFFCRRIECFGGEVVHVCQTHDDAEKALAFIKELTLPENSVNAIYVATATSAPICRYLEEKGLSGKIALVCTDIFDELRDYMRKNTVNATILQNQEKVGSIAVRSAYEYLVAKNSYHTQEYKSADVIYVRPALSLLADIE